MGRALCRRPCRLWDGQLRVTTPDVQVDNRIIGIGSKGWVAGGLVGYNVMLAPRWVAGVEADGSWQNIKTTANFDDGSVKGSSDWSASVRARLGYLLTPATMLFVTAGWSWSEVEITNTFGHATLSSSLNGPQAGFGIETLYSENWIIRTEYLHSFYQRREFFTFFNQQGISTLSPWLGVIRTAVIYKIGPSTATAWPDPEPRTAWTGFYAGGLIGPLLAHAKVSSPTQGVLVNGGGVTSVVPSLVAGYNIMIAPRWIAGIEGEIAPNISTSDVKIEWTGAARVRAGYLVTPTVLAYGSVGWGTAGIKDVTRNGLTVPVERIHAWGYGTGIEAAVSDRWRIRADYQYYWTNTIDVAIPAINAPYPATVKATAQTARLGAIYAFGGP